MTLIITNEWYDNTVLRKEKLSSCYSYNLSLIVNDINHKLFQPSYYLREFG